MLLPTRKNRKMLCGTIKEANGGERNVWTRCSCHTTPSEKKGLKKRDRIAEGGWQRRESIRREGATTVLELY